MFLKGFRGMEIAGPHTVNWTCDWLWYYVWDVVDDSPSIPDFEPTDFRLFGPLKKHLAGKKFLADANMK